jgi:hypothetical protein
MAGYKSAALAALLGVAGCCAAEKGQLMRLNPVQAEKLYKENERLTKENEQLKKDLEQAIGDAKTYKDKAGKVEVVKVPVESLESYLEKVREPYKKALAGLSVNDADGQKLVLDEMNSAVDAAKKEYELKAKPETQQKPEEKKPEEKKDKQN